MLVSARPIGSTVRLRDPAQADRQGSHPQSCHGGRAAEREGMEWRFCRLPATVPAAWALLVCFLSLPESPGLLPPSLSLLPSSSMPGHSALLLQHYPHPLPSAHSEEKAQRLQPLQRCCPPSTTLLACFHFAPISQVGSRGWEVGVRLREPAAPLLADLSIQGKGDGSCAS